MIPRNKCASPCPGDSPSRARNALPEPCEPPPSLREGATHIHVNGSRLTSLIAFYDMLVRHIDGVVS